MVSLLGLWGTVAVSLAAVVALAFLTGAVRYIPNNRVGIVEKFFSAKGSVAGGFIARKGEAGFQPEVLRGGWHVFVPLQYRVHRVPLVTIPQGKIGYVFARDGAALPPSQTLASNAFAADFQDAAAFLAAGGQRGPQRRLLREGTYALNLAQFVVLTESGVHYLPLDPREGELFSRMSKLLSDRRGFSPIVIKGADAAPAESGGAAPEAGDVVGIVTVHDGPSLAPGEIIAPTVGDGPEREETYHNNFQEPDRFLRAGGVRGRQLQVLVEGTYYVNRLFATVEMIPKTVVEVGHVGVVVSYTGEAGADLSGTEYKHGELVASGRRGVWSEPLLPGKYAFNAYAGRVVMVPTTNFILKWIRSEVGGHRFDENLSEVALITRDAFEPYLPLSVVLHIDYRKAPLVIQRFGDVKRLVEQTLDPMIAAYFKNVAQTRTLIELLQSRAEIQKISSDEMRGRFEKYNLELEEVLIGTPGSGVEGRAGDQIDQILKQLRARQVADEQIETYARQERAAAQEKALREAEARAKQQPLLTESELSVTIQSNQGRAEYQRSVQEAARIQALAEAEGKKVKILAEAEAERVRAVGEAEAERAARVGMGEAIAIDEQVRAYGGPRFRVTQEVMNRLSEAIEKSGVEIVPRVVVGGSEKGDASPAGGSVFETLLTMLLAEKAGESVAAEKPGEGRAELEAMRRGVRAGLLAGLAPNGRGTAA